MSEPIHIISLGAGVQSSCMALMAAKGEITPMPTAAIFADTQAEPDAVYKWLGWLTKQLPFPVLTVTKGNLAEEDLRMRTTKDGRSYTVTSLPYFTLSDGERRLCNDCGLRVGKSVTECEECGGKDFRTDSSEIKGINPHRICTVNYKIKPIMKKAREIGGIKRGQKTVGVVQWIGISLDEVIRMKDSREPWAQNRWPLIESKMSRHDCLRWMEKNGYPKPPRSACYFCPYHSNAEWVNLIRTEPAAFDRAVAYERAVAKSKGLTSNSHSKKFLHRSCKPLDEVDFSTEEERGQINMFNNECEGMCGV